MPEIRVEPSGLWAAGAMATRSGERLRGLAADVGAVVTGTEAAAPEQTAAALPALARALQNGTVAVGEGVASLGANVTTAGSVYEQVDREAMPSGGEAGSAPPVASP